MEQKEKKKRVRPTLTQMRQLEKELEIAREACRQQLLVINNQDEQTNELKRKNRTLEMSDQLLKEEIERLRDRNGNLLARMAKKTEQIFLLKNRKFWARVFNRNNDEEAYEE